MEDGSFLRPIVCGGGISLAEDPLDDIFSLSSRLLHPEHALAVSPACRERRILYHLTVIVYAGDEELDSNRQASAAYLMQGAWATTPDLPAALTGYVLGFLPLHRQDAVLAAAERANPEVSGQPAGTNPAPDRPGRMRHPLLLTRSAAVRLLVAYLGALSQSLYAANAFVEQAYNCYRSRLPRWDRV